MIMCRDSAAVDADHVVAPLRQARQRGMQSALVSCHGVPRSPRSKIGHDACLEDVRCEPGRGLDKAMIRDLATCRWIDSKLNVIIVGKTGVGKSYLAAALAQAACRRGRRARFARVPRLVHDLAIARADGTYTTVLAGLARIEVLVLDDFLLAPMKDSELRDLLEIVEDRSMDLSRLRSTESISVSANTSHPNDQNFLPFMWNPRLWIRLVRHRGLSLAPAQAGHEQRRTRSAPAPAPSPPV